MRDSVGRLSRSGGHEKRPITGVAGIIRPWVITPEPAEHFGKNGAGLFARVGADAPGVVQVIALLGQGSRHLDVLRVPIPLRIVAGILTLAAKPAIVIQAILQKDANWFPVGLPDEIGINMP